MKWLTYHTKDISEKYLFRFLSLEKLQRFLETGSVWFSRADQFGDKMECVRIQDLRSERPNYRLLEERKRRFLISCWHLATNESLSLWDTYAATREERRNVALRFKRENLVHLINEGIFRNNDFYYQTKWVHGTVQYKNLVSAKQDALNNHLLKYPAFRKEAAFRYEMNTVSSLS